MGLWEGRDMASKRGGVYKRGRDAITGRFITLAEAKRRPKTTIIETVSGHNVELIKPRKGK
jgi:hypothetical protein